MTSPNGHVALMRQDGPQPSAWERVQLARHAQRPYTLDYLQLVFNDFLEMHGDRLFADDPAIIGGLASLGSRTLMVIGHQKGRDTKENVLRRFGMARPEGYRKALRLMRHAEKFGIPVVTLVDIPGADPSLVAEERGQAFSIAENLLAMAQLRVPIVSVIIGEGGSGGALALALGDRVLMLENAIYSVASPEAAASILWKDGGRGAEAAEAMRITAPDLLGFGVIDGIIAEPLGGAHTDHVAAAQLLQEALIAQLDELEGLPVEDLLGGRAERYRAIGAFQGVSLEGFERTAVELARAAGDQASAAFKNTVVREFKGKKQDDVVTVLDRGIETFLRTELRQAFPDHGLLGEEHADDITANARYVWVLDPIDGTMNFASGLPLFGISVGLLHDGAPVVGCIWVPVGPTLGPGVYHARLGGGAWFDSDQVCVSRADDERGRIMALPGGYLRAFRFRRAPRDLPRAARALPDARTTGSCTAELVLIASGVLRAGVFIKPSIWDVAAGTLIVREAGGRVLTWRNGQWLDFERFEPEAPARGKGDVALRHWGRPLLLGAPDAVERLTARIAWHPRLPRPLQKLIGL